MCSATLTAARAAGRAWIRLAAALRQRVPALCPLCAGAARGGSLCQPCQADVRGPAVWARCPRCALRLGASGAPCASCAGVCWAYDYALAAFDYRPPADALILQFKSSLRYGRATMLAELMAQAIQDDARTLPPDTILVPVPSTQAALRRRGFNPAAELARALGNRLALPVCCGLLVTANPTVGEQKRLGRRSRLAAGPTRFRVQAQVSAPTVLVVDDVMTTGATLQAAASVLKAAGAQKVVGIAAARTPARPPHGFAAAQAS